MRVPGAPGRLVQRAAALRGAGRGRGRRRRRQPGAAPPPAGRLQRGRRAREYTGLDYKALVYKGVFFLIFF